MMHHLTTGLTAIAQHAPATREFMFASPHWLWLLLLLLPLLLLRRRRGTAAAVQHPGVRIIAELLPRPATIAGSVGPLLAVLAAAAIIIALAGPRWKTLHEEPIASGIDIMIACDLSGSMAEKDMIVDGKRKDRLTAAQHVIKEFISNRPNDRMGMVAFAGKAKLCSPLTMDHNIVLRRLKDFYLAEVNPFGELIRPGYIIEDGTAIGSAIASAATRLNENKDTKSKIIILVTDGMSNRGQITPIEAAQNAATLGIRIYPIAIGKDRRLSRNVARVDTLDEKTLKEIAKLTGGTYYLAGSSESLEEAFRSIDMLEKTDSAPRKYEVYDELFYWPMGAAAILLVLAALGMLIYPKPAP